MNLFLSLGSKLIPFYLIIVLGFIAGKYLNLKKEAIASLLIYIITPIIVFSGAFGAELSFSTLSLPLLTMMMAYIMCLLFYYMGRFIWKDSTRNILAFAAGHGNVGYFGLPVAIAIFGDGVTSYAVLAMLGFFLYESTLGFFIVAKGTHTIKDSMKKLAGLPSIYTFIFGVILNISKVQPTQIYFDAIANFKGAFAVLGMMMIGIAIAGIKDYKFDWKFIATSFSAKFLVYPLLAFTVVFLDSKYLFIYNASIHNILMLFSMVPIAANTVAYATELKTHPEKAAVAVFLSTLFALFYIPLMYSIFIR
ncbi:MAG: AEC family transporter [archaeon]